MKHWGEKCWMLLSILLAIGVSQISSHFNGYYMGVWLDCGMNIILAVSLNLINGYTGQFSLGHAGFMAVGAYTAAKFTEQTAASCPVDLQPLVFAAALVIAALCAGLAGFCVGVPSLRLKGDYLAIVTLGFGEIIRVIVQNTESVGGASGMSGIAKWSTFAWTYSVAAVCVYIVVTLVRSSYGRGFVAVADDEVAACSIGINPVRFKVIAFVIGAAFAGMAGALYAHHKQTITPTQFDFLKSIDIVVMVILGGMGRTAGVIAAAIILTWMPELLRSFADYRMMIYAALIIVLMIWRPDGLFVWSKRNKTKSNRA